MNVKPVINIIGDKINYFSVAGLIFTSDVSEDHLVNGKDIYSVKICFEKLLDSFDEKEKIYSASFIKNTSALPYTASTIIGSCNTHMLLCFQYSYKDPILFIYDMDKKMVKNYVDIKIAKQILEKDVYDAILDEIHYKRNLNYRYPGINSFLDFLDFYKDIINKSRNDNYIKEDACIEIEL